MAAIKALEQWCKNQCDGYRNVAITNMTTSFRDGLAFCALIHKHRPDLINYESLAKENVYENNNLAFRVAEDCLGIPALLDAEDMVALRVPDRLSILTYVSQYHNYFNGRAPCGGVGGVKRPAEGSKEEPSGKKNLPVTAKPLLRKPVVDNRPPLTDIIASNSKRPPKLPPTADQFVSRKDVLVESSNKTGTLSSTCAVCKHHVHLVQRHLVDGRLYHRSCFKCTECCNTLRPGAYKSGLKPGTFICTTHHTPQNDCKTTSLATKSAPEIKNAPSVHLPSVLPAPVTKTTPATRPISILSAPIRVDVKPVSPPPESTPWTASAQKTQAARQRFFLSGPATTEAAPAGRWAPATSESRGPSRGDLDKGTLQQSVSKTSQNLAEGNCNNNNICSRPGLRGSDSWAESQVPPPDVSRTTKGTTGPEKAKIIPDKPPTHLGTIPANNKEGLWRRSAHKESLCTVSSRIKDLEKVEAPSDWRAMLKPVPTGKALNSEDSASKLPQNGVTTQTMSTITAGVPCCPPAVSSTNTNTPSRLHNRCGSLDLTNVMGPSSMNASMSDSSLFKGRSFCIPVEEIRLELAEIEERLNDLEKQGVETEKRLRECEAEGEDDVMDALMVDWFNLIQTKQAYIRRESELVYIAKTQDLEEQQPGVEGELRRLLDKPEHLKSAADRQREQELMERLMEIVRDRNTIVVVLDEDRLREEEEDQQLQKMMQELGKKKGKSKKKSPIKKLFRRIRKKDGVKN